MDLDQLFHRQQVSPLRAAAATSPAAFTVQRGLANGYAGQILVAQRSLGALATPLREA